MPFTVAHGILGVEGIHNLSGLIDMGDQAAAMPRIKLDRITGLHSLVEVDDNREARYGQGGEIVYRSLARGRTIVYEGRLQAADIYGLRALERNFRYAASYGRSGEQDIVVRPGAGMGGVSHAYTGRVLSLDIDDVQTRGRTSWPTPFQRSFMLTIRQGDPRYYLVGHDVVAYGVSGQTVTVNNTGNAPALPHFVVNGPVSGTLRFDRLGNFATVAMVYAGVELASGQALLLNFKDRTLRRASDDASFEHFRVFDDSSWWDAGTAGLNAGLTNVKVTGGGSWSVSFAPASW